MYYRDEFHRYSVARKLVKANGVSGYKRGEWARIFKKYPLLSIPVGAALVFDCPKKANQVRATASKYEQRGYAAYKQEKRPDGYHIWRVK